jgi:hypothetical protein
MKISAPGPHLGEAPMSLDPSSSSTTEMAEYSLIVRAIERSADQPYVQDIHREASMTDPTITLPKVYGLLKSLIAQGRVRRLHFGRSGRAMRSSPRGRLSHSGEIQ